MEDTGDELWGATHCGGVGGVWFDALRRHIAVGRHSLVPVFAFSENGNIGTTRITLFSRNICACLKEYKGGEKAKGCKKKKG